MLAFCSPVDAIQFCILVKGLIALNCNECCSEQGCKC